MKQFMVKLSEFVSIVCLVAFIIFVSSDKEISGKNALEIAESVASEINLEGAIQNSSKSLKKQYGIDSAEIDSFSYYSCENVMDVRELLIVKVNEDSQGQRILSILEEKLSEKKTLFESYAPEQSAILSKAVLVYQGGFVFYAVGEDSDIALAAFNNIL